MRFYGRFLFVGLIAMACVNSLLAKDMAPAVVEPLETVLTMHVDGSLVIDPEGKIASFQTSVPMSEDLRANLDRVVLGWQFQPITVNGVARTARAKVRIVLAATQVGEKFQVKVDNVVFPGEPDDKTAIPDGTPPPITSRSLNPPQYPFGLMRAGVGGAVLLGIRVGADGKVAEVTVVQSMLFDIKGRDRTLRQAIAALEQSAVTAARRWTFNVAASDKPLAARNMTVSVPIEYQVELNDIPAGKWRTVVRLPKRDISWLPKTGNSQQVGVADASSGEVIPTETPFKLTTTAVGAVIL